MNVGALFARAAARAPESPAIRYADRRLTYRELNERASRLASGFGRQGLRPGGLATVRQVRFLVDDAVPQIRSDRRRFPPFRLNGGQPGSPSENILNPGPQQKMLPTTGLTPIVRDDVPRHALASGGGWGDPLDRDPEEVRLDVRDEKLSVGYAREKHGVVIDAPSSQIDRAATLALRAKMREGRK